MRILYLTYYFRPDLCAGSFRNSSLFEALKNQLGEGDFVHVITTVPNRYGTYSVDGEKVEEGEYYRIDRVTVPMHASGMVEQAKAFVSYYKGTMKIIHNQHYDLVFASSSRLFTAFLGKRCAAKLHCPLYLDVRDIFTDVMKDIFKNRKMIQVPSGWLLNTIEWYTFRNATHINLISGGFQNYFKKYSRPTYSYYSNGIDEEFIEAGSAPSVNKGKPYYITYAGNIGSGQGMEKIIPEAAKRLGSDYIFRIIGDGGTRKLLEARLKELKVANVELLNPMARKDLIRYYQESTFLFVHLNDLEAFTKVLPSKIFEFGAFDKPIIAGVSGYAAEFVKENVPNHILFKPTDVDDFASHIKNYQLKFERREEFLSKFARKEIDMRMAVSILAVLKNLEV